MAALRAIQSWSVSDFNLYVGTDTKVWKPVRVLYRTKSFLLDSWLSPINPNFSCLFPEMKFGRNKRYQFSYCRLWKCLDYVGNVLCQRKDCTCIWWIATYLWLRYITDWCFTMFVRSVKFVWVELGDGHVTIHAEWCAHSRYGIMIGGWRLRIVCGYKTRDHKVSGCGYIWSVTCLVVQHADGNSN